MASCGPVTIRATTPVSGPSTVPENATWPLAARYRIEANPGRQKRQREQRVKGQRARMLERIIRQPESDRVLQQRQTASSGRHEGHSAVKEGPLRDEHRRRVGVGWRARGPNAGAGAECERVGRTVRPVDQGGVPGPGDAAGRALRPTPAAGIRGALPWPCCTNRHEPARCSPTGSSPADAIRHWSAEGGHPIQDLTAEDGLTRYCQVEATSGRVGR